MIIAVGSERRPKLEAVEGAAAIVAKLGLTPWSDLQIIARNVAVDAPAMPISDEELMRGAMSRAENLITLLRDEGTHADLFVGLEGGFHCEQVRNKRLVFLRGWAYATDGNAGYFGSSPSIEVPHNVAAGVFDGGEELGAVIDRVAGEHDVRSKQGTWGILTLDLLTRRQSFEMALLAALAPFYNKQFYR